MPQEPHKELTFEAGRVGDLVRLWHGDSGGRNVSRSNGKRRGDPFLFEKELRCARPQSGRDYGDDLHPLHRARQRTHTSTQ
eukprot:g6356.t1